MLVSGWFVASVPIAEQINFNLISVAFVQCSLPSVILAGLQVQLLVRKEKLFYDWINSDQKIRKFNNLKGKNDHRSKFSNLSNWKEEA